MKVTRKQVVETILQLLLESKVIEKKDIPLQTDFSKDSEYFDSMFVIILKNYNFIKNMDKFTFYKYNLGNVTYEDIIELIRQEVLKEFNIFSDNNKNYGLQMYSDFIEFDKNYSNDRYYSIDEMRENDCNLQEYSCQKISAILLQLVKLGLVDRQEIKKKPVYKFKNPNEIIEVISENYVESIEPVINLTYEKTKKDDRKIETDKITTNVDSLLDYIKTILNFEVDIYSLKKRYIDLKKEYIKTAILNSDDYVLSESKLKKKRNDIESNIKKINTLISNQPKLKDEIKVDRPKKPRKPVFNMKEPLKPVLLKSNIFNKKKIEKENANILLEYENQLKLYNDERLSYEKEMDNYNNLINIYNEEMRKCDIEEKILNEEAYNKEVSKYNTDKEKYYIELEKCQTELLDFDKNYNAEKTKILNEYSFYKEMMAMKYEMEYIISIIKKDIELQNELYSLGVIYEKYRNYGSLSTFCEYLESGRCDSLKGPHGAYNIYEKEIRDDTIINKLDVVIDSLVQTNNQLQAIKNSLDMINGQLLVNNILQVVQIEQLDEIIENTDNINYNTRVAAFYAQKTANYTKGLYYINLFK